jgi:hypothetical protein
MAKALRTNGRFAPRQASASSPARVLLQWAAPTAEVMPLKKRTNYNTRKSFDRVSE